MDGTLVNSLSDIASSANHALSHVGLRALPPARVREFVGDGVVTLLTRCLTEAGGQIDLLDTALDAYWRHHDEQCIDTVTLYPEVAETLPRWSAKRLAVITNKPERFARKILRHLNLDPFFAILVGGDSLPEKKPSPLPVHFCLQNFQTEPSCAMMVGDGPQDIATGRTAGVLTCSVTYGFHPRESIQHADILIDSFGQLRDVIR